MFYFSLLISICSPYFICFYSFIFFLDHKAKLKNIDFRTPKFKGKPQSGSFKKVNRLQRNKCKLDLAYQKAIAFLSQSFYSLC